MPEPVTKILEILDDAIKRVPPELAAWRGHEDSFLLHLMEIELETDKPLCERLGVSKGIFPPEEELEDDEIKVIVDKILELWSHHNYFAEILEGQPPRKAYSLLLSVWEDPIPLCVAGSYHFDFYDEELENVFE